MKKKISIVLLGMCMALSLVACGKDEKESEKESKKEKTTTEAYTENEKTEETEADKEANMEEVVEDTTEATTEAEVMEIVDAVPEGPAEANFGPDNIGFYMEGVEFKLPMAYSEFYEKVNALGWDVAEDGVRDSYNGDYKLAEVEFSRAVEGQEDVEWFDIEVINSADTAAYVDLSDPNIQVVKIHIMMYAGSTDIWDSEAPNYVLNFHSDFYITKEIGLGRNIRNAYAAWGGSFAEDYGDFLWTTGDEMKAGNGMGTAPYISLSSVKRREDTTLYSELRNHYGECEDVINHISLQNNPFVQE